MAEAELERDVRRTIRSILYAASGDRPRQASSGGGLGMVRRDSGFLSHTTDPESLPRWLSEHDVDFYTAEFERTGFRGGLNWYRNIDANWELLAPFAGAQVTVPAVYVAGDRDLVVSFKGMDQFIPNLAKFVPNLRKTLMLPECGHWTQQERVGEVNSAMIDFLREL